MMEEWQKHIRDPHDDRRRFALCGKEIGFEWMFEGLDHAFVSLVAEERMRVCPDCAREVIKMFGGTSE